MTEKHQMPDDLHLSEPKIPAVGTSSYPSRPGNFLRPWIDGEPALRRICEAIESARHSVWATVTFMWPDFRMPDGRGSALDVLSRAAARGLDVRVIFWRPDPETEILQANTFWGSLEQRALLEKRHPAIRIRWDRAQPGFCQHQKSWLIDASTPTETCFLGGINLNPHSMVAPGHRGEGHNHDVNLELAGPAAVDVHHNFVQRWNEATERHSADGRWGPGSEIDLPFPTTVPGSRGHALVRIYRTIHRGRYRDGQAVPGGASFNIEEGEQSNFEQYCAAIKAARRTICSGVSRL
jgi:cardiolipin synthase A/B